MEIDYGNGKTKYGPGVQIELSGGEVAIAIDTYLTAHNVYISGPRTITVNNELCKIGSVYVDPSGFAIANGIKYSGRGSSLRQKRIKENAVEHPATPKGQNDK